MITVSTLRECLAICLKRSRHLMVNAAQTGGRGFRSKVRPIAAVVLLVGQPVTGAAQSQNLDAYQPIIADAAHRFAIPPHWIRAVIDAESAANPIAVSDKSAMGLMQIMPETWEELRERHDLGADPFDPADNVMAGTAYLRQMLDRYSSIALMLAAYNAGPGRLDDHLTNGRALPPETVAYVSDLLPQLSLAQPSDAQTAPQPRPTDPFAAAIFAPNSNGVFAELRPHPQGPSTIDAADQQRQTGPLGRDSDATGHTLFVQPGIGGRW